MLSSKVTTLFSPFTLMINTLVGATLGSSEQEEKDERMNNMDRRIINAFLIILLLLQVREASVGQA